MSPQPPHILGTRTNEGDTCPCIIARLHVDCDPETCEKVAQTRIAIAQNQTSRGDFAISDLKKAKASGCKFCTIFYDGLMLPEIRYVWWLSQRRKVPEEDMRVLIYRTHVFFVLITDDGGPANAGNWRHVLFDRRTTSSVLSSGCQAFPLERSLSDSTTSETSWKNVRDWLDTCESHGACKRDSLVPKRVLDVGTEKKGDVRLLCDSEISEGRYYTTLSYCWGKQATFLTTTKENFNQRREGIKWSELPKTFQEAISITRTLNIRYIWIDSLCIIQDDAHDWETQASQMSLVYQNSYLTIAASHASDSTGGCFASTEKRTGANSSLEIHPFSSVRVRRLHREDHFEYAHAWARRLRSSKPLHTRGWALQERLMSPRILHYSANELIWECNTLVDCQCGGIHTFGSFKPAYAQVALGLDKQTNSRTHNWLWVIEVYTNQNLTFAKDRLPALSGLARQAQAAGWGQYAAGLWREDLEAMICWEVHNKAASTRYPEYLGPSWSWVNISGSITWNYITRQALRHLMRTMISIRDFSITTGEDRTGRVIDGHLTVSGMSIDATLSILRPKTSAKQRHRLTASDGDTYDEFIPDTAINGLQGSSNLSVRLVLWCFWQVERGVEKPLYMVLGPARDRKDIAGSIERSGAVERLGIWLSSEHRQWVDKAAPFENLVFV